ncbi:uncharacterized protein ATC70_005568 [Mucor velutinosus]|uniref:Uncharacterized protein n=1 Tax=Mucor velutinosus TaxID=708070 RepID=A0AAN7DAH0_9FUNG|nr:hypothetical protein ATC70_005568 [Mucor velutinosus]
MHQLRIVESNRALLYKENEKQALKTLLKSCKNVDGNTLRPIINSIFNQSLQSIPSKATAMINEVSNTKTTQETTALASEATALTSEATTLTLEAPNRRFAKDVELHSDTSTHHTENIDGKQNEVYKNMLERLLYDPKMSRVSVKVKRRRGPKSKAALPYKTVLEKEHRNLEEYGQQKLVVKRRKTAKYSYK